MNAQTHRYIEKLLFAAKVESPKISVYEVTQYHRSGSGRTRTTVLDFGKFTDQVVY
jgi:hypothetical protein